MEITLTSEKDLPKAAGKILAFAENKRKFTLTGDLGAGKTTLIQEFCRQLGVEDHVTSPTFSLVNEYIYRDDSGKAHTVHHLDLYRLKDLEEALDIGVEDYLYDQNFCFIEWPAIIESILPDETVEIKISILRNSVRKILIL